MVCWCDLHPDLVRKIVHRLNNAVDAIRVRSVCRSWRNSLPTPAIPPYRQLRLPGEPELEENTVWSLQSTQKNSTSSSASLILLIKVAKDGRRSILNPILQEIIQVNSSDPWILNFLHLRVYERDRFYILYEREPKLCVSKALFSPSCIWWSKPNDLAVLALIMDLELKKNLRLWKYGDQIWTFIESSGDYQFQDITIFEDQFVAVDTRGAVFSIDPATGQSEEFSPPQIGSVVPNLWWRLVVSGVDLFLVKGQDKLDFDFDFEVHKLKYKRGGSECWVEVNDLGSRALLWGRDGSFFIEAHDCRDCKPNSIYYPISRYDTVYDTIREFDLQHKGDPKDFVFSNIIPGPTKPDGGSELQSHEVMKFSIATYRNIGFGGLLREGDGRIRAMFSGKLMDVMSVEMSDMGKLLKMIHFAKGVFYIGGWCGKKKLHIEFSCSSGNLGLMLPLLQFISPPEDYIRQIVEVVYSCVDGLANADAVEVAKQGLDRPSMFQAWD